jgi:hypothetical protein
MNRFLDWVKSKNFNSHSFVVAVVFLAGLYATEADFKQAVDAIVAAHPAVSKYVALAVMIITKYSHSSK